MINIKYSVNNNLGDKLNIDLFSYLTSDNINYCNVTSKLSGIIGIGSILQWARPNDIIWGTGFISANDKPGYLISTNGTINIRAVRGPLTLSKLKTMGLTDKTVPYCDPGVLYPIIFNIHRCKSNNKIGIIPHEIDFKKFQNQKMPNNMAIINVNDDSRSVITQIATCDKIISSSLHGIIIAESLGIDAAWCEFSTNVIGQGFKFYDYFLGSYRYDVHCNDLRYITNLEQINFQNIKYMSKPQYNVLALLKQFPLTINSNVINDVLKHFINHNITIK